MMLIINPRSGKGLAPRERSTAERIASDLGIQLDVRTISGPGHGRSLAEEAVSTGMERVIGAGGDGTLNAIASGLIRTSIPLGVVPLGSGNGYARSLGIPLRPESALHHAFTGTPALMDICYLNDIPFLGTAGIGFDARVARRFDASKSRGMLGYAKIIVQEVLGAPPMPVKVTVGKDQFEQDVLMLVFCNTREFGNGADISPGSRPDDGLAELRLVTKPSFLPLLRAFIQIYTHKADRSPYIRNIATTEATIWQRDTIAHLDGEPIEVGHDIRFRLEAKALWVVR